jgi:3'(2'), 5'-bisphosphate nucleotidase
MKTMLKTLETILIDLGSLLLEWRTLGETHGHWEGTQLKAEADLRAHNYLVTHLRESWPNIPIISEEDETAHKAHRPDEYWLIDPIDGTASFCNGFDGFVTQVALMRSCRPVLAVVHAPALGLTYTASLDETPLCNGVQISTNVSSNRGPILIDNYPEPRGIAQSVYNELVCSAYVESGSLGLKICRVADGTADLFVKDVPVRDWDLAPAHLILKRAGGQLTTLDGNALPYDDGFERVGLIASSNRNLMRQVTEWNNYRTKHQS